MKSPPHECELSLCQIFHAAETKLKRIAIIQHEPDVDATAASSQRRGAYESLPQQPVAAPPMSAQERAVRLNVMRAVGARVQDSTRQFRAMQKEFLSRLKGQEQTGNEFFASDREEPITLDELDMVCESAHRCMTAIYAESSRLKPYPLSVSSQSSLCFLCARALVS